MFNPLDLSGKLILVTGASSGIGRATAIVLSRLGASVVLNGRREEQLHETASLMEKVAKHYIELLDLNEVDAIPAWMQKISETYGSGFSGVVHCAGIVSALPIRAITLSRAEEAMRINAFASMAILRGAAKKKVFAASGCSVVLISSVNALVGWPGKTVYSAAKAALHGIAKSASLELAPKRIRVNTLAPAWVDTPMLHRFIQDFPDGCSDLQDRQVLGLIAPEEVGIAAAYLISDAARHVTGTTLVLDGGYSC
jgi:NAD(P)-dependent dehydrogenase (short-subunit alcohol dehydrogenase family)